MPKKSKRGEGGKGGGKMEDRLQRAQAEEEMAKKKEESSAMFLREKLQKEEKNTAVNLLKLNERWKSILRQTQNSELRNELVVLRGTFERHLEGLDSTIKNLEHDLQEQEHQSAQVRRVHRQHLEHLQALQDKRLKLLQQQWDNSLQHLSSRFKCEREQMLAHSQQQKTLLEDAMFTLEQQHKTAIDEIHKVYRECVASYDSDYQDKKAAVTKWSKVEPKEESPQNQEDEQLSKDQTEELGVKSLTEMIDEDERRVEMLQDFFSKLRAKQNSSEMENHLVEQDLTATISELNQKTHDLRDQLTRAQKAARKQLADLTVQSDSAAKKLKAAIAKGERVLRVGEMCRKLEDKVLPSFPAEEHQQGSTGPEMRESAKETLEFPELQQLTQRFNFALLHREALRKHKDRLRRENQQVKLELHQHLNAMTVSDHIPDGRHALLAVNQAPTTTIRREANRQHAGNHVLDGRHVLLTVTQAPTTTVQRHGGKHSL